MASLASITAFFKGIDDQQRYDQSAQKAELERQEAEQKLEFARLKREEDARLFQLNSAQLQDAATIRTLQLEDISATRPTEIAQRDYLNRDRMSKIQLLTDNFDTRAKVNEATYINKLTGDALVEQDRSRALNLKIDNPTALDPAYRSAAASLVALNPTRAREFATNLGINPQIVAQMSATELTELMVNPTAALQAGAQRRAKADSQTAQLDSRETVAAAAAAASTTNAQIRAAASAAKSGGADLVGKPIVSRPAVAIAGKAAPAAPVAPAVQQGESNGTNELTRQIIAQSALVSQLESEIPAPTLGNTSRGGSGVSNPAYSAWLNSDTGKRRLDQAKAKLTELRRTRLSVQTR